MNGSEQFRPEGARIEQRPEAEAAGRARRCLVKRARPPLDVACERHGAAIGEACMRWPDAAGTCNARMARSLGTRTGFALVWPLPEKRGREPEMDDESAKR
jgi:hypothetical protein